MNNEVKTTGLEPIHSEITAKIRERLTERLNNSTGEDFRSSIISGSAGSATNTCGECAGTGYVTVFARGVTRCQCQRRKILAQKIASLPERFRESTFQNYVPCDMAQQSALDDVKGLHRQLSS